jgi:hypothetical protein
VNKPLERHRPRWKDNTKMGLKLDVIEWNEFTVLRIEISGTFY